MSRRALVIVDMQNDYFPGGKFVLAGVEAAAANAARLLDAARAAGDLVIHIRHEFLGDDAPFFAPASDGARIHPLVLNRGDERVVLKHHVNAFRQTDLKAVLDGQGIEEMVIAGAMSHMCIDGITRAAVDFGYKATVIHDAVATRDLAFNGVAVPAEQVHAAFMAALGVAYATLRSTDDFLAESATAPQAS